ncbi:amino acid adenylation domain-containing protein [Peribacillus butanolivorans]|uniref:amino acid adenylation domain-containing protein n=1 Tax=Peribacillus butanolivorans TaxID=421767 RepID=UPI003672BB51
MGSGGAKLEKSIQNIYSLTPLQEGILYELEMNNQTENLYISQMQIRITGTLDVNALFQAWNQVVDRHEALRMKVISKNIENNVQVVFNSIDYQPEIFDMTLLNEHEQLKEIQRISNESRDMDVNNSNLMKLQLIKIEENQFIMIWTHHHIILDGWSTSIVLNELFEIYSQIVGKDTKGLIEKPKQYGDFIRFMNKTNTEELNRFWKVLAKDIEQPTITFPVIKQAKENQKGDSLFWELDKKQSKLLRDFSAKNHVTINVLLQLIWSMVLKEMSQQNQIVFGIVSSGRSNNLFKSEEIIGLLINTIPMIAKIEDTDSIADLLKQFQETLNNMLDFSQISLVDIKNHTKLKKEDPLFETLFVYENYPEAKDEGSSINWEVQGGTESHSFPLSLQAQDNKETIKCKLYFNRSFLEISQVHDIQEAFMQIANQITKAQYINEISVEVDFSKTKNNVSNDYKAIRNQSISTSTVNEDLKEIWQEFFLNREINEDSDFFQLGGHSITAMKLVSKINKKLDTNIKLKDLFENPTLKLLSHKMFPEIMISTKDETQFEEIVISFVEKTFLEVLSTSQIDKNADFFEIGGHSILAMKLLTKLNKEFNQILTLKNIFQNSTVQSLSDFIINKISDTASEHKETQPQNYVLSSNQEALWFNEKLNGKTTNYNIPQKYKITGKVDSTLLEKAVNHVINRHEILRTIVREKDGIGYQEIREDLYVKIGEIDLTELKAEQQTTRVLQIEDDIQSEIFEIEKGPLLTIKLVKLSEKEFVLFVNLHHFVFDGWSVSIFLDEWLSFYDSEVNKKELILGNDFIQYKDFAVEQKSWLERNFKEEMLFWKRNLSGDLPKLELPLDTIRKKENRNNGSSFIVELTREELQSLKRMSLEKNSTLYMTLLTMYQSFLAKYTGQNDVIVGSSLANRMIFGTEKSIGYFVNTLPFRLKIESDETFDEILQRNTDHIVDIYDHQQMTLEKIIEVINPERNLANTSLFQTVFILQNNAKAAFQSEYINITPEVIKSKVAKFDLSLAVEEFEDKLLFAFEYNSEIFNEQTIRLLGENFLEWIKTITNQPEQSIDLVSVVSKKQEKILLEDWQGETICFEGINDSIPEAFYKIVEQFPDKMAIVDGSRTITYRELNQKSNRLSHYLLSKGISKEDKIGIYVNRSIDMVVGMLAVIKAGAAYVPLDPHYPNDRLSYMVHDSSISYCLTHKELEENGLIDQSKTIYFEDIEKESNTLMEENLHIADHKDLAYVIYTSGTTGRPKGVMLEHRGIINLVFNQNKMMCLDTSAKVLQFATFNFDASVIEIFSSLLFGAELHISVDKENQFDMNKLVEQIKDEEISHIILPPAVLKELPITELSSIKVLGSAGSECPVELVSKFKHISFFNGYGPTEYSVCTSYKIFPPNEDVTNEFVVSIGKPLTNTVVLVLDKHKKIVPVGSVGELYVGGLGLARGYLNNESLTNEKFVPNPFSPTEKLYRTGDLVKFNKAGELVYIGRADDQVKIRGYRVELSEVNVSLRKIEEIKDSFVTVMEDRFENKRLIAYYTVNNEVSVEIIRKKLRKTLPTFMIPSHFMKLDTFPLTPNGKVDQKALPKWTEQMDERKENMLDVKGFSKTETELLIIWRNVLNDPLIGPDDNFFECGGDSIISIQICSAANEKHLFITPKDLFEYQTVRELASIVNEQEQSQVVQETISGYVPLTPIQSWFFNENHENIHHWNQSVVLMKDNTMSTEQYKKIIMKLIDHHDVLRTLFEKQGDSYIGNIRNVDTACGFYEYHVSSFKDENSLKEIKELEESAQQSLNIHNGPIMKFLLFKDQREVRIFWVIHHLVVDGVSWRILLENFERCCQQIKNEQELSLPLKTTSYKQWSEKLNEYQNTERSEEALQYWEKEMNKTVSPLTKSLGSTCDFEGMYKIEVDEAKTQNLIKNTLRKYKTSIDEVLLSVIAHVFSNRIGIHEFWLDLEGHGREDIEDGIDLSRTVGWFTSIYPVRIEGKSSLGSTLRNTKNTLRSVPNKGFDFGILKYISNKNYSYPDSLVSYNYLGQFNNTGDMEQTNSSNINLNYKFPYKLNFVASIVNNRLILNIIGDRKNENFQIICKEVESKITEVLSGSVDLNDSIVETDFESEKIIDGSTITHFINKFNNIEEIYPVTSLQEGMLFHSEVNQSSEYISQLSIDLKGNLDLDKLEEAWNDTCRKYDVLRSVFRRNQMGDRYQIILNDIYYVFNHVNLTMFNGDELEEKIDNLLVQCRGRQIDLENGPLMNITLIQLSSHCYKFIWTHHHALIDGWSLQIVINHFMDNYLNASSMSKDGEEHKLAYKQVMNHVQNVNKKDEAAFWNKELEDFGQVKALASTKKNKQSFSSDKVIEYSLSEDLTEKLIDISKRHRKTINTVVQGVWGIVLSYLSESKSVCYGVTSSGRNLSIPHIESAVGLLINTLPFSLKIDWEDDLQSYFTAIQNKQLQMREYEFSSLTDIKRYAEIPWDKDLFQHIFVFENYPSTELAEDSRIMIENSVGNESTNFDLTFSAALVQSKLHYKIIYKDSMFDENEILRFMDSMQRIFLNLTEDETLSIGKLINNLKVGAL